MNLGILDGVNEALASVGEDLKQFEEVEDAALGNGGLGRLAACYLESAASKNIALDGYGIRYTATGCSARRLWTAISTRKGTTGSSGGIPGAFASSATRCS